MEDVLDLYTRPYDKNCPVICLDETTRQLIGEITAPMPVRKGHPSQYDYEYVRNGVAHLFMMFEPLAAKRYVKTADAHTRVDFAYCLQKLADVRYPDAKKIILVMDNLNVHTLASLYLVFPPEQARQLAERFEIHHTPKHASWLNMAEIEIGAMSRQCLTQRIPTVELMTAKINTWVNERNCQKRSVRWHFTTKDARIKLQHLYPKI
jgi:hypothetical protein